MAEFCPIIWPEEPVPAGQQDCCDCGLDKHGSRMVWGEGNPEAPIMIILDNPGLREDKEGDSFVCGTRETLQAAAHQAGLLPEELYTTYILKRRPRRAYDKEKTRAICMQHLEAQLQEKKPLLLLCMGNVAVQSFFKDAEAEVKTMRGGWYNVRGWRTTVAYHPLAARRRPNLLRLLEEDFGRVAEEYRKLKGPPV